MVNVKIQNGKVQDHTADFVVCEVDEKFQPTKGSGEVTWRAAGKASLDNLRTSISLVDYQIRETPSFDLEEKYSKGILHLKIPSFASFLQSAKSDKLRNCYLSILRKASELDAKSIVLPFIGVVSSNFPKKEGADVALKMIEEFFSSNENKGSLEEIIFYCFDREKVFEFATNHEIFLKQFSDNDSISGKCYYRCNTPGDDESGDRLPPFDLKLTSCGDKKQSVSSFISQVESDVNLLGCHSVLELLNIRANGETMDDCNQFLQEERTICDNHFNALVLNWEMREQKLKNRRQSRSTGDSTVVQCPLEHKNPVDSDKYRVVDKSMCINYLKREGILVPPGTTVCKRHQTIMKIVNTQFRRLNEMERDPTVAFPIDDCPDDKMDFDDSGMMDDMNVQVSPPSRIERKLPPEVITAVLKLVREIGGDRALTKDEWHGLAESTKNKKGHLAKRIFGVVCEVMTPDGMDDLYARATVQTRADKNNEIADKLFEKLDERFAASSSTQEKVELLSLISDLGLKQNEVICCIPSASLHYLNLAKTYNKGGLDFDKKYQRERFDERKSDRFVEFLSRSNAIVTIPWGDTLATLSDGTKTPIASVARKFTFSRIHRMYLRDLEAYNEMDLKLSRGSTTGMLKVLTRRMNERMTCVDEYAVDAYEGWRQLTAVVEELREIHALIGDVDEKALKRWIRISKSHLEGEYITELSQSSNVPQHCIQFALSDCQRKCFAEDCLHAHDGECTNCNHLDLLLSNIQSLTERLKEEAKSSKSMKYHRIRRLHQIVAFSCVQIRAYQAHLLRSGLSSSSKGKIQDALEDGHALLTLDFAMKVLPQKAIEGQSGFYAKKGISLHIVHALAKIDGKFVDHSFAHTLDDVKQNAALIFSIVRHTLEILEKKGISVVFLRSDNAGAYKNSALISSFFFLSTPKLQIKGYYFSESQAGKGPCDRTTSHCKRKTGEWTRAENNIDNARNIFEALTVENETVRGLSTYYCTFTNTSSKQPNAFPGIQQFFSFDFEDDGVRSRCQYGIGEGLLTKKSKLSFLNCVLDVVEEGGHVGDTFWNSLESNEKETKPNEEEDEEINNSEMFHCSTLGCTRSFRTTRWLIEHEIKGKHDVKVSKKSMALCAVKKFKELIETRDSARIAVTEQVEAVGNHGMRKEAEQGWGLKSSFETFGLDKTARAHAVEYFNAQRSLNPPRRAEPGVMRRTLLDAMHPSDPTGRKYLLDYHQIPSEKQIFSLFSRLETSRVNGPKKSTTKSSSVKASKTSNSAPKTIKKGTRTRSSVKSASGTTKKRKMAMESEESEDELEDDVFDEECEEVDDDDEEFEKMDEEEIMKRAIQDDMETIFDL